MRLKNRLLMAFFIIILVPVLLFSVFLAGMNSYQMRAVEQTYGVENLQELFYGTSIQFFDSMTEPVQKQIEAAVAEDPDQFLDRERLEEWNGKLMERHSYLAVRRDGDMIFCGIETIPLKLLGQLPEYGEVTRFSDGGIYTGRDTKCLLKQHDLRFSDGASGTIFIITSMSITLPEVKALASEMLIAVVIILLLTAVVLTTWIYRSIIQPLGLLQKATREIKEGNMDFELEVQDTRDEIGQLCMDFEEMRLRLKESAEEKIQYDNETKELLSNISHDLKTPITAIKGYVEGIMDGVASSPEKLDKYIRTIYNKANDMDRLIDELTFYSKIDTNRVPYVFTKINVASYFKDCIDEVGIELEAKNIELGYFNYCEDDTLVIADAEQMKRVINNIISNSVKYLDKRRGIINIRIKDRGDFIQVEIEDNGKGIAQKDLPYIFDRFYRTDSSRNSSQGGSGIGLSIVRKIIEDHGGRIWATSRESTGTVMHFVLRKYQEVIYE